MVIKKFIAPTMPEALAKVKKELGEEAVILKTRMNKKGAVGDKSVEITAAVEKIQKSRFEIPKTATALEEPKNRLDDYRDDEALPAAQLPSEKLQSIINDIAELKRAFSSKPDTGSSRSFFGNLSSEMLSVGRELIARNLSEDLAFKVVSRVASAEDSLHLDSAEVTSRVQQTLCSMIPDGEPIKMKDSGPTVVMFVGMAGSGKTTAIARVATHYKIDKNAKVAIVTTDNFRADSSHQVKSFCRILGCPCGIVYTPEELAMAIKSQSEGLILVDTPGVSPADEKDISELHSFIRAARMREIHLVASAATPARDIHRLLKAFDEFGIDKIMITKLDETEAPGGVITAIIESGKRLSFVSASREIPGRFGVASPEMLAESITADKPADSIQPEWEMEAVGIWQ